VSPPLHRHVPLRRCALCRASLPQAELIRLVKAPAYDGGEEAVRLDARRRLGGRGTWVCRSCAATAAAGQGEKRLRQAFSAHAPLVRSLLERALVDLPERRSAASGEQDGGVNV